MKNKIDVKSAVCEQKTRKIEIKFKQKTTPRMNYEWIEKTISENNQVKKPLARKQIFIQTLFSHSALK